MINEFSFLGHKDKKKILCIQILWQKFANSTSHSISCSPGGLKIKTSRDAVDIESLTSKKEMRHMTTFERRRIDSRQRNTTASHKLILKCRTPCNLIAVASAQKIHQTVHFFLVETSPSAIRPLTQAFLRQIGPKPRGQATRGYRLQLFLGAADDDFIEHCHHLGITTVGPVHSQRSAILLICQ